MFKRKKSKKILFFLNTAVIFIVVYFGIKLLFSRSVSGSFSQEKQKEIFLNYDGNNFILKTDAKTVGDFILENKIEVTENDEIYPFVENNIFSGTSIVLRKARKIRVLENGKEKELYTLRKTIGEAVREKKEFSVGEDDIIKPNSESLAEEGMKITIIHVEVKEEKEKEPIKYKTIENKDNNLGWREKKVTQKGKNGANEVTYKVVYHDKEEISRKKIDSIVVEEPTEEIVTQGTFMKLGKESRGKASYYAKSWGALNASRIIPRGGYAKVTNLENGESIVVKINDYGPQSLDRVIDMDYFSFSKIADLARGIIPRVKVEQVLN